MRRALQKHVEDRLSEELLQGNIGKGDTVTIDAVDGELKVVKGSEKRKSKLNAK